MPKGSGAAHAEVTTTTWRDANTHVVARQPLDGFLCSLSLVARVPLSPEALYALLTSTEGARIFKQLKCVKSRRVVEQSAHRSVLEVEQVAEWRFLLFRGTFTTKLLVEQDHRRRTIDFRLAPGCRGIMRDFRGRWSVLPFDQGSLDELVNAGERGPMHHLRSSLTRLEDAFARRPAQSLVQLEQSLAPCMVPRPPLDRVLKGIAVRQLQQIMEDLRAEADRLNALAAADGGRGGGGGGGGGKGGGGKAQDQKQLQSHVRRL